MPDYDEFGIPIKKSAAPENSVDEFGITIKKKESTPSGDFSLNDALNYGRGLLQLDFLKPPSSSSSEYQSGSDLIQGNLTKNNQRESALRAYDKGASFIEQDYDARHKQIAASPYLQQVDERIHPDAVTWQGMVNANKDLSNNIALPDQNDIPGYEKNAILNSPSALRQYRQKRQRETDEALNKLNEQNRALEQHSPENVGLGDRIFDETAYASVNAQIDQQKKYKQQLIKSIADVASVEVPRKFIKSNLPIKEIEVGKEYLRVVGDPQIADDEKVLSDIERGLADSDGVFIKDGQALPINKDTERTQQFINYKMFKTGADVMATYFSDQADKKYETGTTKLKIDSLRALEDQKIKYKDQPDVLANIRRQSDFLFQDPEVKNYFASVSEALNYYTKSQKAADQFPQVKRQQLRQKLNDAFFTFSAAIQSANFGENAGLGSEATNIYHGIFGATPSEKDIPLLASIVGISTDEARSIINERVKGFIGESPSGVRVNGLLQGIAQGTDETIANGLMGIRRLFNTDNVETANRILSDRITSYETQAEGVKLRDELGKYNINPNSIFNTMGKGIGQTAVFAAPTLVTGGLGAGLLGAELGGDLATIGTKIIEGASTIATGYAGSYEDAYKEAARYTSDEKIRRGYANITAFENALPELFLSPADIAKKVGLGRRLSGEAAFRAFATESGQLGVEKTIAQRLGMAVKEMANVVGAENAEELTTLFTNIKTKKDVLGINTTPAEALSQAIETIATTTITTIPLGIGAGINASKDMSGIRKEGWFWVGNEPDLSKEKLKVLYDNGQITDQKYNEKVASVNTLSQIVDAVNKTTKSDGSTLTWEEKRDLTAQQFRIQQNDALRNNGAIAADEERIDEDNQEALSEQKRILTPNKSVEVQFTEDDEHRLHELENKGNPVVDVNTLETVRETGLRTPEEEKEYSSLLRKQSEAEVSTPKKTGKTSVGENVTVIEPTVRASENVTVQMPAQVNSPTIVDKSSKKQGVSIDNMDELLANDVARLSISQNGENIPFNTFDVTIDRDNNTAEVAFVEKKDRTKNKGIGYDAYVELGERLAEQGITLTTSGNNAKLPGGTAIWNRLVKDGKAERFGDKGYRYIPASKQNTEVKSANSMTVTEMKYLPDLDDSGINESALSDLNKIDFADEKSVKDGVGKILQTINNKVIPENKFEQVLKTKSKLIGNENYFDKDYLEKYIHLSTKDFSSVNQETKQESKSTPSIKEAASIFNSIKNESNSDVTIKEKASEQLKSTNKEVVDKARLINDNYDKIVSELVKAGKIKKEC